MKVVRRQKKIARCYASRVTERRLESEGCIVVESDERKRGQRSKELDEIPEDILEMANYWATFSPVDPKTGKQSNLGLIYPNLHVVPVTVEADAILTDFEHHADDQYMKYAKKNNIAAILWTRVYEAAGRLAVIYACSKNHKEPSFL